MEKQLKLEELGMFVLGVMLFTFLEYKWWLFPPFLLLPDLSMLGYLMGERIGAFIYNLFHHKGTAVGMYVAGIGFHQPILMFAGIILFSHSSMDRIFGYGLKFPDSFKHTHLGWIGKNINQKESM